MSDAEFIQNSTVDFLIPENTDIGIEEALSNADTPAGADDTHVLARIPQRSLLYFDESLTVYVVLRTPYQDDRSLQKFVPRLNVVLEAQAFSSPTIMTPTAETQAAAQARDVIWTSKLDVTEDPVFVVVGSDEDEDGQDVLLIWKTTASLARPRSRLSAPAIMFRVAAVLRPLPPEREGTAEAFLPSGVPFAMNVLEPLGDELLLSGAAFSPAATVASQRSVSRQAQGDSLPLSAIPRRAFRAIPALSSRLRYHRSAGTHSQAAVMATLELDALTFAQHDVEVTAVRLAYLGGEDQVMLNAHQVHLPQILAAGDNLVCLYALDADPAAASGAGSPIRVLDMTIDARIVVSEHSRPTIAIRWRQNIDFATMANAAAAKSGRGLQRDNRPANISTVNEGRGGPVRLGPGAPPAGEGVIATFAKSERVYVGEPFKWAVSIVNRTERSRHFGFAMLPRRSGALGARRPARSTTLVGGGSAALAEAVVDDNVLYGTIQAHGSEATQLVCLSADTRTGPLGPGAIYSTELEFLALTKGYLSMEAVRVTDLATGETVDIRDLPDVMAVEKGLSPTLAA